jgi:adenosyl cobinamide kinase/adenosyl cobinamide phosphate guanylyltransferase
MDSHRAKQLVDGMHQMETQLLDHGKRILECAAEHETEKERAKRLYYAIEQCVPHLQTKLHDLNVFSSRFHERQKVAETVLIELRNLAAWYNQFLVATCEMETEIIRRHRKMREYQGVIEECTARLARVADEEIEARKTFEHQFGRYLPPSLCPQLQELVPRCRVCPDRLTTELPLWGETNETAKSVKLPHSPSSTHSLHPRESLSQSPGTQRKGLEGARRLDADFVPLDWLAQRSELGADLASIRAPSYQLIGQSSSLRASPSRTNPPSSHSPPPLTTSILVTCNSEASSLSPAFSDPALEQLTLAHLSLSQLPTWSSVLSNYQQNRGDREDSERLTTAGESVKDPELGTILKQ